jgi:hypothetical protein
MCQRVWEPQAGGLAGKASNVTRAWLNKALHLLPEAFAPASRPLPAAGERRR